MVRHGLSINSMKIRYITPFALDKNIGKAYNEAISELPDDCYVVLRDGDTMFLTPDWGKQIEEIIKNNPEYSLITCMTNRIGNDKQSYSGMFNEKNLDMHFKLAMFESKSIKRTEVIPHTICPGMLMIFHKSLWNEIKFQERTIFFDKRFSEKVLKSGRKIGLATGLYLLHLYRWGQEKPKDYIKHLM